MDATKVYKILQKDEHTLLLKKITFTRGGGEGYRLCIRIGTTLSKTFEIKKKHYTQSCDCERRNSSRTELRTERFLLFGDFSIDLYQALDNGKRRSGITEGNNKTLNKTACYKSN